MKPSEVLRKAKGLIDSPEKWFGPYSKPRFGGRLCAGMAIDQARLLSGVNDNCFSFFNKAIHVSGMVGLVDWNNTEGRTHSEVMSAFDAAIALAEQEEGRPTDAEVTAKFLADMTQAVAKGEVLEYATEK